MLQRFLAAALALVSTPLVAQTTQPLTYCNPLNLDHPLRSVRNSPAHRHGADPVVVLYKDRYYLFSTWDTPGYRVSDDLVRWTDVPFAAGTELAGKSYTAAAVAEIDGALCFVELNRNPTGLYRTTDPDSGKWERVATVGPYADPCLFVDPPTGRVFMYYGLDKPITGVELDRKTFQEIPGTQTNLMPDYDPKQLTPNGWEVCTVDHNPASPGMRGNKTANPCREGAWMTYRGGKYYLQFASPGTTVPGYADGCMVGDSPLGPFKYLENSPISQKLTGFITSAGHSCLFQDRYGNDWRAVTMLVGVRERFERRVGLFPAGFTEDGVPYTRTDLDGPITVAGGRRDHGFGAADLSPGWALVSYGKGATASSTLDEKHGPALAADEDIRTQWSARTGEAGEYFQLDLGAEYELRALQLDLAEQDVDLPRDPNTDRTKISRVEGDRHAFVVTGSVDGQSWVPLLDWSGNQTASPHTYYPLASPTRARHVRVTNTFTPAGGKFSISDLRVFATPPAGSVPAVVTQVSATRNDKDRRQVTLTWPKSDRAAAYLVRYGVAEGRLHQHHLLRDPAATTLTLYSLNPGPHYFFRVDALNESGTAQGTKTAEAP